MPMDSNHRHRFFIININETSFTTVPRLNGGDQLHITSQEQQQTSLQETRSTFPIDETEETTQSINMTVSTSIPSLTPTQAPIHRSRITSDTTSQAEEFQVVPSGEVVVPSQLAGDPTSELLSSSVTESPQAVDEAHLRAPARPPAAASSEVSLRLFASQFSDTVDHDDSSVTRITQSPDTPNSITTSATVDTPNEPSQVGSTQIASASVSVPSTVEPTPIDLSDPAEDGAEEIVFTSRPEAGTTTTNMSVQFEQPTSTAIADSSNNSNPVRTMAIIGGAVGGVAIISMIAFLLWFRRKKMKKKRRSSFFTPFSAQPLFVRSSENFTTGRESLGPSLKSEKIRAELSNNVSRIRRWLSAFLGYRSDARPSVNLNRGNSQFLEPLTQHVRKSSRGGSSADLCGGMVTKKDRLVDWWHGLTEDVHLDWKVQNDYAGKPDLDPFAVVAARNLKEQKSTLADTGQHDFLSLPNVGDEHFHREASLQRHNRYKESLSESGERLISGLGLSIDGRDPFADRNALRDGVNLAPLVASQSGNPPLDGTVPAVPNPSVPKPTTYTSTLPRSRGSIVRASPTGGSMDMGIAASTVIRQSQPDSYRESLQSLESFAGGRNKFRSDPFDLERPELLANKKEGSGTTSTSRSIRESTTDDFQAQKVVSKPVSLHMRSESLTSRYPSSWSHGDWSEPGPDVGPAASRWKTSNQREIPNPRSSIRG